MDEELISKKDLLELTGISYGQLYRWKRKNVIPEEWFIKKSTFTGQETFFPKEKILDRIDKIINLKDGLSLDDLADKFSNNPSDIILKKEEIIKYNLASKWTFDVYEEVFNVSLEYSFDEVLYIYILDRLLQSGDISVDEGKSIINLLNKNYNKLKDKEYEITLLRRLGVGLWIINEYTQDIYYDENSKVVIRHSISKYVEELKLELERHNN
ncbi:YhbD family protein [Clostridium algidicarnis]|uniref:YhbD family protein n=1 Tax=Clostridium algidicarnis TaxID=37659 RepID=UPI001C0C2E11|nr:YhbD family protein [Clostridium algidicarnis]MBU3204314.1 YhbD family protein [Clostridium algidicarnis]MBU3212602.1 YhbD family protein [Clostridium algidicarnis]MBU3223033.1 YhbD family protein [Clostridium algidicarnis]